MIAVGKHDKRLVLIPYETSSVELSPNVTAEINKNGEIIGLEILNASTFVRDSILETAQAKLMSSSLKR